MKCVLKNKDCIKSLVDPLDVMIRVFQGIGTKIQFRYEFTEDSVLLSNVDKDQSLFVNYKLRVSSVMDDYSIIQKEIGIWDTAPFIKILKKYGSNFYAKDAKIKFDFDVNKFKISCGKDTDTFYTCSPEGLAKNKHDFDTSTLDELIKFKLEGINLMKLLSNIDIYTIQDTVVLSGSPGEEIKATVCSHDKPNQHESTTTFDGIVTENPFRIAFTKDKLKAILESNDTFNVVVLSSPKKNLMGRFMIENDHYFMSLALAPRKDKK